MSLEVLIALDTLSLIYPKSGNSTFSSLYAYMKVVHGKGPRLLITKLSLTRVCVVSSVYSRLRKWKKRTSWPDTNGRVHQKAEVAVDESHFKKRKQLYCGLCYTIEPTIPGWPASFPTATLRRAVDEKCKLAMSWTITDCQEPIETAVVDTRCLREVYGNNIYTPHQIPVTSRIPQSSFQSTCSLLPVEQSQQRDTSLSERNF